MIKFNLANTGAWCNGSTPAFEAVDLGSTPSAPACDFVDICGGISVLLSISYAYENTVSGIRGSLEWYLNFYRPQILFDLITKLKDTYCGDLLFL